MKTTFRAAVLVEVKKPLEIMELEFPILEEGQILVQNRFSGICRSQLMEVSGQRGKDSWLPHLLGHEGYGVVREIGPSVTKVSTGNKVIISWIDGVGIKSRSPIFKAIDGRKIHSGLGTTFSEFSVVSENKIYIAPLGFPDEFIPQFGCALLTGGGMVLSNLPLMNKDERLSILVLGFGGVGTAAALMLSTMHFSNVVVIDKSESRQAEAKKLGFNQVFSSLEEFYRSNANHQFDYCFEAAGSVQSILEGFKSIKNNGVLVFASHPKDGDLLNIDPHELIRGKTIKGTWGGNLPADQAIIEIEKRLHYLKIDINSMLGPKFTLDNINQGLSYLQSSMPGKPLIDLGDLNW
jgi:S-(hydroxymethyl)glutathione dehydrogenase/alcohol dehydrogenase